MRKQGEGQFEKCELHRDARLVEEKKKKNKEQNVREGLSFVLHQLYWKVVYARAKKVD